MGLRACSLYPLLYASCHGDEPRLSACRRSCVSCLQQEATREDLSSFKASKAELEDQLKIVNEEFTIAKAQMDEKWNNLKEARAKQETVSNEFQRLKEIKDTKWKERYAARDELQSAPNQFYENRRFSQKVFLHITSCIASLQLPGIRHTNPYGYLSSFDRASMQLLSYPSPAHCILLVVLYTPDS
jgi:hypothetical protein